MTNFTGIKSRLRTNDPRIPYVRRGWEDARLGRPFDYDFVDRVPSKTYASNYEMARLRVMALRDIGINPVAWNSFTTVPPKVREQMDRANEYSKKMRVENHTPIWPIGEMGWLDPVD